MRAGRKISRRRHSWLGELFTTRRTERRQTDLVIVVTPRIVDMSAPMVVPATPVTPQIEAPAVPTDPVERRGGI